MQGRAATLVASRSNGTTTTLVASWCCSPPNHHPPTSPTFHHGSNITPLHRAHGPASLPRPARCRPHVSMHSPFSSSIHDAPICKYRHIFVSLFYLSASQTHQPPRHISKGTHAYDHNSVASLAQEMTKKRKKTLEEEFRGCKWFDNVQGPKG